MDTGTVTNDPGFEDYRVSVGVGIRLRIAALSNAPLAFDFGFPIKEVEGDEDSLFSFSIDVPF
jgi:outer membrane protein assembly factor BamA